MVSAEILMKHIINTSTYDRIWENFIDAYFLNDVSVRYIGRNGIVQYIIDQNVGMIPSEFDWNGFQFYPATIVFESENHFNWWALKYG